MGLDMYLNAKRYISKHFDDGDELRAEAIQKLFPELDGLVGRFGDNSPVNEVKVDVGYWRKSNQIHAWFVKNVQGGTDDCGYWSVQREDLQQLRDTCQQVLDDHSKATELLPAAAGFFFGSTDYDAYYYDDLEVTIAIIDRVLALPLSWDIEYHSSW